MKRLGTITLVFALTALAAGDLVAQGIASQAAVDRHGRRISRPPRWTPLAIDKHNVEVVIDNDNQSIETIIQ